jgi:hypothetical protein
VVTTTSVGYTILLHLQLFDIFPVLVIGPFLMLCLVVHFWIRSGKAAAKAKLAKLMPSPVVNKRKQLAPRKADVVVPDDFEPDVGDSEEDDGGDLAEEIELRMPEREDLIEAEDATWKNFGTFVHRRPERSSPTTAASPVRGKHVTRRQSVTAGVQMLNQMRREVSQEWQLSGDDYSDLSQSAVAHRGMQRNHNSANSLDYQEGAEPVDNEAYESDGREEGPSWFDMSMESLRSGTRDDAYLPTLKE